MPIERGLAVLQIHDELFSSYTRFGEVGPSLILVRSRDLRRVDPSVCLQSLALYVLGFASMVVSDATFVLSGCWLSVDDT